GVSPTKVQAILAGGSRALTQAVEGAEDWPADGAAEIAKRRVGKKDVGVGISAIGTTPFVVGAMNEARNHGAMKIALTANRRSPMTRHAKIIIAPDTGPEVIAGSTRMKAGTAQKMVLNMLSTVAMVRLGYVYDNLMINMLPTNKKL